MKTTLSVLLIIELYGLTSCLFKEHFFVNKNASWDNAQQHCKTHFTNLSTFTSESEEQQFLKDAIVQTYHSWVGLYKESNIWKWAGGENAIQISWDYEQPDSDSYAYLNKTSKKLHDRGKHYHYTFFCMMLSEFVLVPLNQTWEGALKYCRYHNTDLSSLSSSNRINYAVEKIIAAQTEYVWTGLRFLAGEWFWVNGDDLDYMAWSQEGQLQCPARNLRCGALDKNNKVLMPRNCEEKLNFICS